MVYLQLKKMGRSARYDCNERSDDDLDVEELV